MRIAHLHTPLLQLLPDGGVVDAKVSADTVEGLAVGVELDRFIDLLCGEAALADLDACSFERGRDGCGVDVEVLGEFMGFLAHDVELAELPNLVWIKAVRTGVNGTDRARDARLSVPLGLV